ncbi:LOW QUALITY PROTEIN: rab proteins geranylgeranyltransferase component A 1 [Stegostoma tigrinum]|uniref:LOW QUALITY PROTEIN: rab proteins geranylgeranyltransferase component A 1 n=1 Tax=Stegostoma tigrinum TaxID=3053191 RepID=UPI0028703184|nr:LOW QUALITY PROTEIN: rab proteins geranylgeranyltransferase component A 1 [Stegostoma tigrinum]
MADALPEEVDVVILGTGLQESIIAAACSRIGQRVLHIDRRNYYGGNWASFSFSGLLSWIKECKEHTTDITEADWKDKILEGEDAIQLGLVDKSTENLEYFCYASTNTEEDVIEVGALENKQSNMGSDTAAENAVVSNQDEKNKEHTGLSSGDAESPLQSQDSSLSKEEVSTENKPCSYNLPSSATAEISLDTKVVADNMAAVEVEAGNVNQATNSSNQKLKKEEKITTYSQIIKNGRKFNIDLTSKFLYSCGSLVNLLIKSNVSRYAEFKNITRILTFQGGNVEQVPCSRADVFASKQLTMVEKRMLMKFLTFCLEYEQHPDEYIDFKDSRFSDYLKTKKLTANLQHFILHSIAMVSDTALTTKGLKATQHFLRCLGRYGNTPFLFPLYGVGEIPQCFCRMSAVFGGTYCLRHTVKCLVVDRETSRCKAVIDSNGQRISCRYFIVNNSYLTEEHTKNVQYRYTSRGVLITNSSVLKSTSEQISILTVPAVEKGQPSIRVIELSPSSNTCPQGTYLVHLTHPSNRTAKEDLEPVVSTLYALYSENASDCSEREVEEKPQVLWALYFNVRDTSTVDSTYEGLPSNVFVCCGPDPALGFEQSVKQAEDIFHQICPGEEFCPMAPNPEDIIYDGDGVQPEGSGFGTSTELEAVQVKENTNPKSDPTEDGNKEVVESLDVNEAAGQSEMSSSNAQALKCNNGIEIPKDTE